MSVSQLIHYPLAMPLCMGTTYVLASLAHDYWFECGYSSGSGCNYFKDLAQDEK